MLGQGLRIRGLHCLSCRLREALRSEASLLAGPVEVDGADFGGRNRNGHRDRQADTGDRVWVDDKSPVMGAAESATGVVAAEPVAPTARETAESFVREREAARAETSNDTSKVCWGLEDHQTVHHLRAQYVSGEVHTNTIESFWAAPTRGYKGASYGWSVKHLHHDVNQCATRFNLRHAAAPDPMAAVLFGFPGRRSTWEELVT